MDIKKVGSFMTVNEAREKYEMKPLEFGDVPTNATLIQNKNAEAMAEQQQKMNEGQYLNPNEEGDNAEEQNPFDLYANENEDEDTNKSEIENSFVKAFDNFLKQEGI